MTLHNKDCKARGHLGQIRVQPCCVRVVCLIGVELAPMTASLQRKLCPQDNNQGLEMATVLGQLCNTRARTQQKHTVKDTAPTKRRACTDPILPKQTEGRDDMYGHTAQFTAMCTA